MEVNSEHLILPERPYETTITIFVSDGLGQHDEWVRTCWKILPTTVPVHCKSPPDAMWTVHLISSSIRSFRAPENVWAIYSGKDMYEMTWDDLGNMGDRENDHLEEMIRFSKSSGLKISNWNKGVWNENSKNWQIHQNMYMSIPLLYEKFSRTKNATKLKLSFSRVKFGQILLTILMPVYEHWEPLSAKFLSFGFL